MDYGKGAGTGVTGVALLPFTGDSSVLFIVATSLIGLGIATFVVSLVLARKKHNTSTN